MSRDITFQVLAVSKVLSRLDVSDNFWVQYGVPRKELKKQVGLYEVENINNAYILAIAVNPKEYFEKYKNYSVNKKHCRNTFWGILCKNKYTSRILST